MLEVISKPLSNIGRNKIVLTSETIIESRY